MKQWKRLGDIRAVPLLFICLLMGQTGFSNEFPDIQGQLTYWNYLDESIPPLHSAGIRYIASATHGGLISDTLEWDGMASATLSLSYQNTMENYLTEDQIEAHRFWGRLLTDTLEARLGLQKINFGPGKTLRALQWFDQIDPKDPTGFTKGVKGLLLRNYFSNDANLWGWWLYDNTELMGNSPYITYAHQPEWGGRFQYPMESGEIAISLHQRKINAARRYGQEQMGITKEAKSEKRIGLDAIWDWEVGLWLEGSLAHIEENPALLQSQQQWVLGVDYTFDIGNGLYASLETLEVTTNYETLKSLELTQHTVALVQSYPLDLIDTVKLIEFWDNQRKIVSFFGVWQKTFDQIIFNTSMTWDKKNHQDGKGFQPQRRLQFLIQYNH